MIKQMMIVFGKVAIPGDVFKDLAMLNFLLL